MDTKKLKLVSRCVNKRNEQVFRFRFHTQSNSPFEMSGIEDIQTTLAQRLQVLEQQIPQLTDEIKRLVGMRMRRNEWINKIRGYKTKNISTQLGIRDELCKIYPCEGMKVKNLFKTLTSMWSITWTPQMIQVLKIINYY